jgi:DNA-binding XRE family transcriptional regulator
MTDKIQVRDWAAIRDEAAQRGRIDPDLYAEYKREMLDDVRAFKLGEVRKSRGLTQEDVASAMNSSQPRVSQLENGDIARSELGTLRAYVEALGGHLRIVADFGDEQITVE